MQLTGLLKVSRRRSLVFSLSLCLFLGVHQHILLFLAFSLSSSFSSTSISDKKIKNKLFGVPSEK